MKKVQLSVFLSCLLSLQVIIAAPGNDKPFVAPSDQDCRNKYGKKRKSLDEATENNLRVALGLVAKDNLTGEKVKRVKNR